MKNAQLKIVMLLALIALQFSSCENEPLEGQFEINEELGSAASGEMRAKVDGVNFVATDVTATYIIDTNSLIVTGIIPETGETIELGRQQVGLGVYSLAYTGTTETRGVYVNPESPTNPYQTLILQGGDGELRVQVLSTIDLITTGLFEFNAFRQLFDDAGNEVLDGAGNPVFEEIQVTDGTFKDIPYTIVETNGNIDDGSNPVDPENEFTAKVDNVDFISSTIEVNETEVGGVPMLNVVATNSAGAKIRIDIPKSTGVGTFAFETDISDGTDLIALYNQGAGGENLTANPGTITITEFGASTGKLAVTFQFTGRDPLNIDPTVVEITEGSFYVDYIENTNSVSNEFMADVDGEAYVPSMIDIVEQTINEVDVLSINATDDSSNRYIQLNFPKEIEVGTYAMSSMQVNGDEVMGLYVPDIGNSANFSSSTGSLLITSYDPVNNIYEGSFSFTAEDLTGGDPTVYSITNGNFVIQLQ